MYMREIHLYPLLLAMDQKFTRKITEAQIWLP
jgi:hypothetical protein